MKTKNISVAVLILLFSLIPTWILAATMNDLEGSWDVEVSEKFTVKKLGKDTDNTTGTVEFSMIDDLSGTFIHDNDTNDYIYNGNCSLDSKGKKLIVSLDGDGIEELKAMLEEWIVDWAGYEGLGVADVQFNFQKVTYKPAKISKKTNAPNKATMTVKGTLTANVTDDKGTDNVTVNFTYIATIKFLQRP